MQQQLLEKLTKSNSGSIDNDQYQFQQICQIEPIGNKLFKEFCEKAESDLKNTSDFLSEVRNFEVRILKVLSSLCRKIRI